MNQAQSLSSLSFRPAQPQDVEAIVTLVNSAYRGDSSRQGWTTEADILDGQRTDAEEIHSLITADNSLLLLGWQGDELVSSVHLEKTEQGAYLGMLTIKPGLQGQGLGKQVMREAEEFARQHWGAQTMRMTVITLRHELIAFYERRGYRRTGELIPFPTSPRFGLPKVESLQLEALEKRLA